MDTTLLLRLVDFVKTQNTAWYDSMAGSMSVMPWVVTTNGENVSVSFMDDDVYSTDDNEHDEAEETIEDFCLRQSLDYWQAFKDFYEPSPESAE